MDLLILRWSIDSLPPKWGENEPSADSSSSVARLQPVDPSVFIGRAVRETGRCRQTQRDLTLIFRPAVGFHQAAFSPALEGIEGFCFS